MRTCMALRAVVECFHSSIFSFPISTFSVTMRLWCWENNLMKWGLLSLLSYWMQDRIPLPNQMVKNA